MRKEEPCKHSQQKCRMPDSLIIHLVRTATAAAAATTKKPNKKRTENWALPLHFSEQSALFAKKLVISAQNNSAADHQKQKERERREGHY